MKKLLMTLVVALGFCGSIIAQEYESHWPDFYGPAYMFQGGCVAAIELNGEIITADYEGWDAFEVAFFVGDECRGAGSIFPEAVPFVYYLYNGYVEEYGDPFPIIDGAAVYYNNTGEEVTVKIYDHLNEIEYDATVTYLGEPFTIITGDDNFQGWDDPENPIIFSIGSTEPEIIYWNDPTDWPNDSIPVVNVVIPENTEVIIPAGYAAYANTIEMGENSVIVIEEGGELYHNDLVELTIGMNVEGYGGGEAKDGEVDGYRLIASPAYTNETDYSIPVEGTNLNVGTFDLYKFDQERVGEEWLNYKQLEGDPIEFTDLYLKHGYLYANEANRSITFNGYTLPTTTAAPAPSIDLTYSTSANWKGWNLVGNPFTCKATVSGVSDFYVMNEGGSELVPFDAQVINPMQGIFVQATTAGQSVTFTPGDVVLPPAPPTPGGSGGGQGDDKLNIRVNGNNGDYDLARIRFGQGQGLEKFMLNENHTKIYFPVDNKDYAVVYTEEMGVMPVNFKAQNNGAYTISFTSARSFNYLHLIDNMTGADVDVLANPSYTFNAQTTDYASRFKLVYATGNNSNEESFAFFSNGNFIINNDGEATLQVVDVMGRILSSNTINGCANISVNGAAGVYMLRLINGNNVKVQKVIVK